ncbi:HAD-IA family hydrolase [Shewanella sp. MBTL60-007]|uniref:HAD-IA family hydrolase n=1 Tax=Shewanella sp. MBTL60-007 TaxID=2815911 RepID=UPI001BBA555A|nr:HAD-IA family hydrolase [Shewanella sp. MBTL60-007]GIU27650.1 haloacid dehalogenase [Shewanella sp. MBTL60-007]
MKIYIRPQAFQAISFDLDDTLYDNRPIIIQAESELQTFLHQAYPKSAKWQLADWRRLKLALFRESPELRHDTTVARLTMLERGLLQLGYDAQTAKAGAKAGLEHFVKYRSHFKVSTEVIELLAQLKQKYRLIGITNGNVDHQRIGLEGLFEFVLHPGHGYKQKPSAEMFVLAAEKLGLPLASILHIGDSAKSDVYGARRAGCQAVWLNPGFGVIDKSSAYGMLPHIEISSVQQLRQLL